ncbi:hypothetical protein, partial [Paraclostridium bifermentans]|uniref:hypothetical protein n=1 Tax=Paraclostridium bifermentans TaxID=1490 RepID=UPI0022E8053E
KGDILRAKKEFIDKNLNQKNIKEDKYFNYKEENKTNLIDLDEIPSREKGIEKYSEISQIDALLKLKNLLDLNVIDEDEFKLLKHKLISRI